MVPFYGWGSTASRLEPFRGGSLLFSTIDLTRKIEFPFRGSPLKNNIKLSALPSKKKKKNPNCSPPENRETIIY